MNSEMTGGAGGGVCAQVFAETRSTMASVARRKDTPQVNSCMEVLIFIYIYLFNQGSASLCAVEIDHSATGWASKAYRDYCRKITRQWKLLAWMDRLNLWTILMRATRREISTTPETNADVPPRPLSFSGNKNQSGAKRGRKFPCNSSGDGRLLFQVARTVRTVAAFS